MRKILLGLLTMLLMSSTTMTSSSSFYDYVVTDINGEKFDFSQLKGKRVMIVNTASKCGYTPQYEELQSLYEKYSQGNFVIIGFPANNFGSQEPGTNEEIAGFCQKNYGVTFPMMSKISVKGSDMHPVYKWLTEKDLNGSSNNSVRWNFHKFLIDENGNLVESLGPGTSPMDEEIVSFASGK